MLDQIFRLYTIGEVIDKLKKDQIAISMNSGNAGFRIYIKNGTFYFKSHWQSEHPLEVIVYDSANHQWIIIGEDVES